MSSKYTTLQSLAHTLPVPPLGALSDADYCVLWKDFSARKQAIEDTLKTVRITAGAFLDEHMDRIARLAEFDWSDAADAHIEALLASGGFDNETELAVRSSANIEDGTQHSFAGIFATHLSVQGVQAVKAAVLDVWCSGVSRQAILERLRASMLETPVQMTVIVQRMVKARFAGVAFSHDPLTGEAITLIETVASLGEAMVSGVDKGMSARVSAGHVDCAPELERHKALLLEVAALAAQASALLGTAADIEWAADEDQLWLLQARPVTSLREARSLEPVLDCVELYLANDDALMDFRPLPAFAQYFRSKRRPLAVFAHANEVSAGQALLVKANRQGLGEPAMNQALLDRLKTDQVVLDFSDQIRQQILDRGALLKRLLELSDERVVCFAVREFLKGETGLITQACDDGSTTCEWSPEGLLAINRGIARTSRARLAGQDPAGPADAQRLHRITHAASELLGSVQLEWVRAGEQLHLIDFSPLSTFVQVEDATEIRLISPGFADGPAVVVTAGRNMEELSISATVSINSIPTSQSLGAELEALERQLREHEGQAIIVSPRPYAALAALLPFARGFVFEQASMLCHLSILLREHGVPAVESETLYRQGLAGQRITFSQSARAPAHDINEVRELQG
ncbi:PEP/pyruvate-binding domain-containing protein [Pseudomonas coronafaciens]|uniref:Phosphoenolpyruvate synthase n=1 Tax=Pseudomonas coronafaciens pv. coronafaciens TaxID=235275 RepID=A0AAE6QG27_9PSED|nr:PEP/pyruvate-binding domain-containing protein [Pseudomonas coronafaciens]QGT81999.1 phosphoenolpyruvate synthase [Pseudomonas coronafaciens pv. coronafaciens]QIQ69779.1 Prodigiosin synthesizing transferase PigC [Pseudomonas coronafaciens]RMS09868.1 Pyruvate phosphate dikinase PEP/pyruvate binding subunit [Pseudomonas coronafaciens pv. coronafaciens]